MSEARPESTMAVQKPLVDEDSLSDEFYRNVQLAFSISTFTEILLAMSLKLLELAVPNAETIKDADEINYPLGMALLNAETIEEHNIARNRVVLRVWQLGALLPSGSEKADFLVDREQMRELLRKLPDVAPNEIVEKYKNHAELGDWQYPSEPNGTMHLLDVGDWSAEIRFSDRLVGLGKVNDFFRNVYTQDQRVPAAENKDSARQEKKQEREEIRPESAQETVVPQPESLQALDAAIEPTDEYDFITERGKDELEVFADAIAGSSNCPVALSMAILENSINDIIWALNFKLVELGMRDAELTEADAARTISLLTKGRAYADQSEDSSDYNRVIAFLQRKIEQLVDALPPPEQSCEFLCQRSEVLRLIGDRAQDRAEFIDESLL